MSARVTNIVHNKLIFANLGIIENTLKSSYILPCSRNNSRVTSAHSIMTRVRAPYSPRFWTSTTKKWKNLYEVSQGNIFERLILLLFSCLGLDHKVMVFQSDLYTYANLDIMHSMYFTYWTTQSRVYFRVLCVRWDSVEKKMFERAMKKDNRITSGAQLIPFVIQFNAMLIGNP